MTDNARNSLHSTSLLVGYCTVHCTVYTQYNAHWWTTSGGIHSVPSWGSQQQCLVHCNGVHSSLRILGERAHLAHWHICTLAHLHIGTFAHWHIGTVAVHKNIGCWSQVHFSKSGGVTTTTVVGHSCGHTVLLQMPCSWSGHCSGVGWYGEGG